MHGQSIPWTAYLIHCATPQRNGVLASAHRAEQIFVQGARSFHSRMRGQCLNPPVMHNGRIIRKHLRHSWLFALLVLLSYAATAQTVYITRKGEEYHKDNCHHLSKNKISTTRTEAKISGTTQSGAWCKRMTTNASGIWYQHS